MAQREDDTAHLPVWLTRADSTCWDRGISLFLVASIPIIMLAVWTIISPGWKDWVRFATGRSWSHRIRRAIEEAEELHPDWITRTGRFLSYQLPIIDQALWTMAFREGVVFGLSHWMSMAMKIDPCPPPGSSSWGKSDVPIDGRPGNFDWQPGPTFVTQEGTIVPFLHNGIQIPPHSTGTIHIAARYSGLFSPNHLAVRSRIVTDTGEVLDQDEYNGEDYDKRFNGPMVGFTLTTNEQPRSISHEVQLADSSSPLVWWADSGTCFIQITRH